MKNKLIFILHFLVLLALAACTSPTEDQPIPNANPPNILVILADDMGFSDIGCYGSEIQTPNLDALAEKGLRFTQFYNAARCCPTRASLLTGLYPHQVGMGKMVSTPAQNREKGPYQGYLREDSCLTIAEALKPAGYRTYMSGKWHVGEASPYWPEKRGFDKYWGLVSGASSYYEIIKDQPRDRVMVKDDQRWEPPEEGFYMTDATTDYMVEQLSKHHKENQEKPFFAYVAYTAPHWPLHALPEDIAKYEGKYDIGWDSLRQLRYQKQEAIGLFEEMPAVSPRPSSIPAWETVDNKDDWSLRMAVYAAMVDRMDQGIGKIIEQLKANGQFDNTLIVFLSDNGGCAETITGRKLHDPTKKPGERGSYVAYREPWANASNTPFRYYKAWTHQGGMLTPFIMHYPNGSLPENTVIRQTAHIIDLMPTFLNLAGVSYPDNNLLPLQGMDLMPLINAQEQIPRKLAWEHFNKKAIISDNWKLVNGAGEEWELYDLAEDPTELNDRVDEEKEKAEALLQEWQEWAEKVGVETGSEK